MIRAQSDALALALFRCATATSTANHFGEAVARLFAPPDGWPISIRMVTVSATFAALNFALWAASSEIVRFLRGPPVSLAGLPLEPKTVRRAGALFTFLMIFAVNAPTAAASIIFGATQQTATPPGEIITLVVAFGLCWHDAFSRRLRYGAR